MVLSNIEDEYRGAVVATCKAMWLKRLLKDLLMEVSESTIIYYCNLNNVQLAKKPIFHAQTKHIEVHYHFVYEQVLSSEVERIGACSNKLACGCHFLSMLVLHHLNMSNLRGRSKSECERDEV